MKNNELFVNYLMSQIFDDINLRNELYRIFECREMKCYSDDKKELLTQREFFEQLFLHILEDTVNQQEKVFLGETIRKKKFFLFDYSFNAKDALIDLLALIDIYESQDEQDNMNKIVNYLFGFDLVNATDIKE